MSDHPKRPLFRFHLLTLVLMTFAAGGMIGVSICDRSTENSNWELYGWPFVTAERWVNYEHTGPERLHEPDEHRLRLKPAGFAAESVLTIFIIASVAFVSEYLIRRREARKP
jgi:hypothetical protein